MDRYCERCIHHISGECGSWDCKMTTLENYKAEVIEEFAEKLQQNFVFDSISRDDISFYSYCEYIKNIAEQLKAGL